MSTQPHFSVLRVILPAEASWTVLPWFGFDGESRWLEQGEAELSNLPGYDVLEVILPARRVSAHKLTLPVQAEKHLESLIAQALEDRVLGDKADVISLPGPRIGTERLVWVCSRRWIETELARFTAAGLVPDRIFPDYELFPEGSEAVPYAQTANGFLFRAPDGQFGLAATQETIALLTAGQETRRVPELYRLPSPASCRNRLPGPLARFNQKAFDPRRLRPAALLLALSGGLLFLGSVIHWRQLEYREARLQHEIRQTFASTFPGTPIIDPVLQWESKVREQTSSSQGDALDAVLELAAKLNVPIHPRRFESSEGFVRLTLTDTEAAQFKSQLDNAGHPETSPAEPGFTRLQFSRSR